VPKIKKLLAEHKFKSSYNSFPVSAGELLRLNQQTTSFSALTDELLLALPDPLPLTPHRVRFPRSET
jgi:hypothetical protein